MGRKTWDSLPDRYRPLPGRRNVVVTRDPDWTAQGAERVGSFSEALGLLADEERVYVIGGAEIYAAALPFADELELTEVGLVVDGDTRFPDLGAQGVRRRRPRGARRCRWHGVRLRDLPALGRRRSGPAGGARRGRGAARAGRDRVLAVRRLGGRLPCGADHAAARGHRHRRLARRRARHRGAPRGERLGPCARAGRGRGHGLRARRGAPRADVPRPTRRRPDRRPAARPRRGVARRCVRGGRAVARRRLARTSSRSKR